ncbi:MAG: D-xylose transporter ATP-binding protein [Nocardioides sp.]|nr:D-xylose transporter ATP-binding protein [Nocardioides sp.]
MAVPDAPDAMLVVEGVTKRYQGVTALLDVDLSVRPSEIHALLGGNGAGKSTLINVLAGVTAPDEGTITLDGERLEIRKPSDALAHGITTVHQELSLVPALTTLDNIFLGREMRSGPPGLKVKLDRKTMTKRVESLAAEFGLSRIDLQLPVGEFGALKKRVVEIVKALAFEPRLLILDEPTSGLEDDERHRLFEYMRALRDRDVSLIWVTHHLDELFGLADTATVFRDGQTVGSVPVSDTSTDDLVQRMFGIAASELSGTREDAAPERVTEPGAEVLRLSDVSQGTVLREVSLSVHRGEILGIAGLAGAGRTELARAIMGVDKISSGSVHLHGKRVQVRHSSGMYRRGLAMVPEDRKHLGILGDLSIAENISISNLRRVSRFGFVVNKGSEAARAEEYRKSMSIRTPDVHAKIRNLSGGNQQKVIVARCLNTDPSVLIFDEPTQGIDVSAKVEVHNLIRDFVAAGGAAIVIASEVAELIELSHRVLVMKKGRLVGEITGIPEALADNRYDEVEHRIVSLAAGRSVA